VLHLPSSHKKQRRQRQLEEGKLNDFYQCFIVQVMDPDPYGTEKRVEPGKQMWSSIKLIF
jgi:hypothetical protein